MYLIQQVTRNALQKQSLVLLDGSTVTIEIYFRPLQMGWFINEISRNDFVLRGVRITNSPNILNQFRNKIPFGLACYSTDNREPAYQDDFSTGASKLYILSAEEVEEYAEYLSNG